MQDTYLTISNKTGQGTYTEKRSKFLAFAHHINNKEEIADIIAKYRKEYYDARHVCYAYMTGTERTDFRANDDGEPSSTAGKPILGQINSRELTDVIVIVVRYYGGVNLGTGGLIVAYREASSLALDDAEIIEKTIEESITYSFAYPMMNDVMKIQKDMSARIVAQEFDNTCSITLSVPKSQAPILKKRLEALAFK